MFNFPTEDIAKAFEAFSEAILDDDALWPNRYGMPPKKYGLSLQKKHLHKPFTPYQYIPITPKNLHYMRRTF